MSDAPRDGEEDRGETEEAEIDADEGLDEADADAGEGNEDDEAEGQEGDVDEPPARPSRRENRVASLSRRLREAERERDDLRRTAQPAPQPQRPDPAAQERAEAEWLERVSMMAPQDQIRELRSRTNNEVRGHVNAVAGQLMDQMDRQGFQAAARNDPSMQRLAGKVEETIANLRAQGNHTINRDTVFTYLFGQEALQKRTTAASRQRRDGQRRIAQQTTRPGSARSDASRGRRPAVDADEELLRNTTVGDF